MRCTCREAHHTIRFVYGRVPEFSMEYQPIIAEWPIEINSPV